MTNENSLSIVCQNTHIISHGNDNDTCNIWNELKKLHDPDLKEFFEFSLIKENDSVLEQLKLPGDPSLYEWFINQIHVPTPTRLDIA